MIRHALTRNRDGGASGPLGALLDMLAKDQRGGVRPLGHSSNPKRSAMHSDGNTRDEFCGALEQLRRDGILTDKLNRLCGKVWHCTDILPRSSCDDAGVPQGSTYTQAARAIRARKAKAG
jgi:hypothetical protein